MVEGNGFTKKELKEILAQHVLWLDSGGELGTSLDVLGDDFRGADLTGVDLRGATLTRASLFEADLNGATLTGADLIEANLRRANLNEANLRGAALIGANLKGAQLGPEIRECWSFAHARVSEDQVAWLCLHPRFSEWIGGLEIVN